MGRAVQLALIWTFAVLVGASGIVGAFFHVLFAKQAASSIGWSTSPFQFENAMGDLGVGVLGILCIWLRGRFWLATGIVASIQLSGDAIGHVYQLVVNHDTASDSAGLILYTDFGIPLLVVVLGLLTLLATFVEPARGAARASRGGDAMTVAGYLLIAALVGWSLYRQLQLSRPSAGGLLRLPIIFGIVGVAVSGDQLNSLFLPPVLGFTLASIAVGAVAGVCRGYQLRVWRDASGWATRGTSVTVAIWLAMIAVKVGLGVVEGFLGIATQGPSVGEIFLFLALSFVVQNLVVASRTVWRDRPRDGIPANATPDRVR